MGRRIADIRYRVLPLANPAAGAGVTFRNPGQFVVVLRSLVFTLVTGLAAANRFPELGLSDGSTTYWRSGVSNPHVADSTIRYTAFPTGLHSGISGNLLFIPLDTYGQVILPGHVLTLTVANIQAADQLSAIAANVLEMETGWIAAAIPVVPIFVEEFDPSFVG